MGSSETTRVLRVSMAVRARIAACAVPECRTCMALAAAAQAAWDEWRRMTLDFRAPRGMDALF